MEDTIIVDGKQFILTTDVPLTTQQKEQTITEIRRQSGCGCDNKMEHLGDIQILQPTCITITMLQGPIIAVQSITIDGTYGPIDCTTGCTATCIGTCPATVNVAVIFSNTGDVSGDITPTLTVGTGTPISPTGPTPISVPSLGTATATFSGVTLDRHGNTVCVNWT